MVLHSGGILKASGFKGFKSQDKTLSPTYIICIESLPDLRVSILLFAHLSCSSAQLAAGEAAGAEEGGLVPSEAVEAELAADNSHVWDFLASGWHMLTRSLLLQVRATLWRNPLGGGGGVESRAFCIYPLPPLPAG